jgi:hypothetical protein
MSTAPGTLIRNNANRITALFVIDDLQYSYSAIVSPSIQPFTSQTATVEYSDVDDLTSTRAYNGKIGTNTFQLTIDNGPTIKGNLDLPGVDPASSVNGTGAWEQN